MAKIKRTYPTPDTNRPNCGPRERALAVFKYLLDIEPEDAKQHPRFQMIVNAFEQERTSARIELLREMGNAAPNDWGVEVEGFLEPLEPELVSERDIGPLPLPPNLGSHSESGS